MDFSVELFLEYYPILEINGNNLIKDEFENLESVDLVKDDYDVNFFVSQKVSHILYDLQLFGHLEVNDLKIVEHSMEKYQVFISGAGSEIIKKWSLEMDQFANSPSTSSAFHYVYAKFFNGQGEGFFTFYLFFTLMLNSQKMKLENDPSLKARFLPTVVPINEKRLSHAQNKIDMTLNLFKSRIRKPKLDKFRHFKILPCELKRKIVSKLQEAETCVSEKCSHYFEHSFSKSDVQFTLSSQHPSLILLPLREVNRWFLNCVNRLIRQYPIEKPIIATSDLLKEDSFIQLPISHPELPMTDIPKLFCSTNFYKRLEQFLNKNTVILHAQLCLFNTPARTNWQTSKTLVYSTDWYLKFRGQTKGYKFEIQSEKFIKMDN